MTLRHTVHLFLIVTVAATASAGVTYRFESTSSGFTSQTISGTVKADQGKVRIDITSGDGILFQNGDFVLGGMSGAITIANPARKTFYEIDPSNLLGSAGGVLSQMQGMVNIDTRNAKASVRDAGSGGKLEGYDTQRSIVDSSYELVMDMLGQKMSTTISAHSELWWTPQIPIEYAGVFQTSALRTGLAAIDRVLSSQTASIKGFPLQQVTTTKITVNGNEQVTTSTSRVTGVKKIDVAPAEFVLPAGYTKTDSPIDTMMKSLGK